jgi:hypothetical protein
MAGIEEEIQQYKRYLEKYLTRDPNTEKVVLCVIILLRCFSPKRFILGLTPVRSREVRYDARLISQSAL